MGINTAISERLIESTVKPTSLAPCTVSYTHLDVYKRQAIARAAWYSTAWVSR